MNGRFYITTAIAYANANPHIGFALELIQADVFARWNASLSRDTFFLTGTDEHGTKIAHTAEKNGLTVKEFVDKISARYVELAKTLSISNNDFIRTTDQKKHWPGVYKMWELIKKDLYKKSYKGLYCSGCEAFKTEYELVDGACSDHPNIKLEIVEEENYFFALSKYAEQLKKKILSKEFLILPESRRNEMLSFIEQGLEDVSFSRSTKSLKWGIPLLDDKTQVIYVWCDALTNYLSALGFGKDETLYNKFWPADIHIIGKDIIRFHALIWPAMLLSAGIKLPKRLFVHGFITCEGHKMSKSVGNVVDPFAAVKRHGVDALRYYLLREIPSGEDGDFSENRLRKHINSELADDLGNLLSRTLAMVEKYFDKKIPSQGKLLDIDKNLIKSSEIFDEVSVSLERFELHKALERIWMFIKHCNKYVADTKPWENVNDKERLATILYNLVESLRIIAIYITPFMPSTGEKIFRQIGQKPSNLNNRYFCDNTSGTVARGKNLFVKQDLNNLDNLNNNINNINNNGDRNKNPDKVQTSSSASCVDSRADLRVGKIIDVSEHPNADKLYVLTVDLGKEQRTLCAGIKKYFSKEELNGRNVVVVANLKPAKLRGVESQGMMLAAEKEDKVVLLDAGDAMPGTEIHTKNNNHDNDDNNKLYNKNSFSQTTKTALKCETTNQNKKLLKHPLITIEEFSKLNFEIKSREVFCNGKPLRTSKGMIKADIDDGARVR